MDTSDKYNIRGAQGEYITPSGKYIPELQPQKLVIWGDVQGQFIDPITDNLFNEFLTDFRPDVVVLNGDIVDFASISHFLRDPKGLGLEEELIVTREYLRRKRDLLNAGARVHFNAGNHEDRLRKYVLGHADQLGNLLGSSLAVRDLLQLPSSWSYTEYHNPTVSGPDASPGIDLGGLLVLHGNEARRGSGSTARACFDHFGGSGVVSHTHRLGTHYRTTYKHTDVWMEAGCMCQLNPSYDPQPDWQQGFVAGYIWPEVAAINRFDIHPVPIANHRFSWEGRLYR